MAVGGRKKNYNQNSFYCSVKENDIVMTLGNLNLTF